MRAHLGIVLLIALDGCKQVEELVFTTDLRRKNYPEQLDTDGDGITDRVELAQQLDPDNPDMNGNGIPDGDDDNDGDGMSNSWEFDLGFDPNNKDSASTKWGSHTKNNGLNDCEEDLDGDGLPNCWEIDNGLDPTDPNDDVEDDDADGYNNEDEYPDYDPQDPNSHPDAEKDLILYDNDLNIAGRTNSANVRATARFCFGGDDLLITATNSAPSASDSGWTDCTTAALALSSTLPNPLEGKNLMYMWRKNPLGVVPTPTTATVTYDITGPSGAFQVSGRSYTWIDFAITPPTDSDYTSVTIRRFDGTSSCSDKGATEGTAVTVSKDATTLRDSGLTQGTNYCYKIFWYDDLLNVASTTADTTSHPSTTLEVTGCSLVGGHSVWYVDASIEYSMDCDNSIDSVVDSGSNWPSFLSLATTLPTSGAYTISGTTNATLAQTNWTALVNSVHVENFSTTVLDGTGVTYGAAATVALPDATDTTVNHTATLDAAYDGDANDVAIKGLMGSTVSPATHSNGNVATVDSDIPLLSYTDAGGCAGGTSPWICPSTSSYDDGTNIATGGFLVNWDYSRFDHGSYFVRSKSYVLADDAPLYGSNQTTALNSVNAASSDVEFTIAENNIAFAPAIDLALAGCTANDCLGDAGSEGAGAWIPYQPMVRLHRVFSDAEDQKAGVIFHGRDTVDKHFSGTITIDRSAGAAPTITTNGFQIQAAGGDLQVTADGVDTFAMAVAPTSVAAGNRWISVSAQNTGSGGSDLVANLYADDGTDITTRVNLTDFASLHADLRDSTISGVGITLPFNDGGTQRHGVAFAVNPDDDNNGRYGFPTVFVTKVNSEPASENKANLMAGALTEAGNFMDDPFQDASQPTILDAVEVWRAGLTIQTVGWLKIIYSDIGGTDYLFAGWREDVNNNIGLVRVNAATGAKVNNNAAVASYTDEATGRPNWSMAVGLDAKDGATQILALLTNNGSDDCRVLAFKTSDLTKATTAGAEGATADLTSNGDCRFGHIFFDDESERFVAVYIDGSASDNDTVVRTFQFHTDNGIQNATAEVVITDRENATTLQSMPCSFSADYMSATNRLATYTTEGKATGAPADDNGICSASKAATIDMYKVAE